jgi:hypothetical protein
MGRARGHIIGVGGSCLLAFDVSPDRSSASVAAAGLNQEGKFHVEIGMSKKGTGWLVEFLPT